MAVPIGGLFAFVVAAAIIGPPPRLPLFGQSALVGIPPGWADYPRLHDQIVPRLLSGVLFAIGPRGLVEANTLYRLVAAGFYLAAAGLLAQQALRSRWA